MQYKYMIIEAIILCSKGFDKNLKKFLKTRNLLNYLINKKKNTKPLMSRFG